MIGAWIAMQSGALWIWGGVAKSVGERHFPDAPLVAWDRSSVSWLRLFRCSLRPARWLIVVTYLLIKPEQNFGLRECGATFQDPGHRPR